MAWTTVITLRPGRAAPAPTEVDQLIAQPLQAQVLGQRGRQGSPARASSLIVEGHLVAIA